MKTIEVEIYQYNELTKQAKENARAWYAKSSAYDQWWENIYEDAAQIGIKINSFDLGRGRDIKGEFITSARDCADKIMLNHGTDCDTYKTAHTFSENYNTLIDKANKAGEPLDEENYAGLVKEFLFLILQDYFKLLQKEFEWFNSDESIEENIIANEYEFFKSGKRAIF